MGGQGSSRWNTRGRKKTTENQLFINIYLLRKKGCLRPGLTGSLTWSRGDSRIGYISYTAEEDRMILNYTYKSQGCDFEYIEQTVDFEQTVCNYGGQRTWFLCSNCQARVAVIYCSSKYFLCRRCQNLAYRCQQQTKANRLIEKARKIRNRLGGDNNLVAPFPKKPKNLHWKTFLRLCRQSESATICATSK